MYHSITFYQGSLDGTKRNTWDDWHLVSTTRPSFDPPQTKNKYLDIPGADGTADLTEALRGYPVYENRKGSFSFVILNGYEEWYDIYSKIMDFLHGKALLAILEDEPTYYYKGRFFVDEYRSSKNWSGITIGYEVEPYKLRTETTLDDWLWDPFNFDNGIIQNSYFKNLRIDSDEYVYYSYSSYNVIGRKPVCPTFIVDSTDGNGITVKLTNRELGLEIEKTFSDGRTKDNEFIFSNVSLTNTVIVGYKGHGIISVEFRSGGL